MRVRIEFTVQFDADDYRHHIGTPADTNTDIREQVKEMATLAVLSNLNDYGIVKVQAEQ